MEGRKANRYAALQGGEGDGGVKILSKSALFPKPDGLFCTKRIFYLIKSTQYTLLCNNNNEKQ